MTRDRITLTAVAACTLAAFLFAPTLFGWALAAWEVWR